MNFITGFFIGISFSLIIEIPLLFLLHFLFFKNQIRKSFSKVKIGLSGLLATTFSYPWLQSIFLNICFIFIDNKFTAKLLFYSAGELMVFLIEAFIYKGVLGLKWKFAFLFSFICNLVSFLLGLILFRVIPL